jgi:hypothetical protein
MPDRFDYELRAIEVDRRAETKLSVAMVHNWHNIARVLAARGLHCSRTGGLLATTYDC